MSQGCATLTLGCLTLSAPAGLVFRFINAVTDGLISYYAVFAGIIWDICGFYVEISGSFLLF